MSWFSRSRLSAQDKDAGLVLIWHLQKMLAYQQVAMEGYNDAMARSAGMGTTTNEGLMNMQPAMLMSDPAAVRQHVLPALTRKIEIFQSMEREHKAISRPTTKALRQAYDDFSSALRLMQERARLQHEGFSAWADDPTLDVDMIRLDAPEFEAISRSAASLNELIAKIQLETNAWLDVNCDAFNAVRASIGLPPMSGADFRSTHLGGLAGEPARFFSS